MWSLNKILRKILRRSLKKTLRKILRRSLKKTLRKILRRSLKKTLRKILRRSKKKRKKSQKRLHRWTRRRMKMKSLRKLHHVENNILRIELEDVEIRYTLMRMGRERTERQLYRLGALPYYWYERTVQARDEKLRTMPPRRLRGTTSTRRSKRAAMEKLITDRVAEAIAEYEQNRTNPANAGGSGNVQGCSHKTFMNEKPHPFNGNEGVICLRRWIKKIEQTLTLKGDDIEAYNNRFHELALMRPDLVPTKKKVDRYIKGFLERIKGNITSSKPVTLHDAINMARELVEQAVHGRAARIEE
uniref:Reverse transcriptase domain-containing protein n=1 Tax=Tanacetum cinerariifolium TaxID=118510 RepID=A0A6L2LG72_TANCI|nr:hypothetical protein [Tanacetum cinerariifolium]